MEIKTSSKLKGSAFVIASILLQVLFIPFVYGLVESIFSLFTGAGFGLEFYFLNFPVVNYTILFSIIIVTSVQETTKSELLASVMNAVWILFIISETHDAFRIRPFEYLLFVFCIAMTIPVRILFQKRYRA
ncbi:MAG: hypothetical protein HWE22_01960 [Flavobacteriales bacterium]|nr:hypothetical protein [Flavobacteriales bacterium]